MRGRELYFFSHEVFFSLFYPLMQVPFLFVYILIVYLQCGPRLLYPFWTGFWLLWHLSWFIVDPYNAYKDGGSGDKYYFTYLTNWGYIFLGLSNLVDFICTIYVHCKRRDVIHVNNKTGIEFIL